MIAVMQVVSFLLVFFFFIIPAFIRIYPPIVRDVAFLNRLRWPPFLDLNKPSEFGLNATLNFNVQTDHDITVGAWHMLPSHLSSSVLSAESDVDLFSKLLSEGQAPVILYLHGNAGTRAGWHRIQLYKVLTSAGFHVITFDYRGYGDSPGSPSEDGLVHDSVAVFKWIKQRSGSVPLYIWGHSLGSAVAVKTSKILCEQGADFQGLILESPFNNFVEAASNHPFSMPFRILPWFTWCFIEAIKENHIHFASDQNIAGVTVRTVILHALDDGVVPYSLGLKLYDTAVRTKKSGGVELVTFDARHGYGHKHIHKAADLVSIIKKFTSNEKI